MRRLGRTGKPDANQHEIVLALRAVGASVLILSGQGFGCFDVLVGWKGQDFPMEIKAKQSDKLTDLEQEFHRTWKGRPIAVVYCSGDALRVIGLVK